MRKDPITVADVIRHLQKFPLDLPVVYAADDEGNSYQAVVSIPQRAYAQEKVDYWTRFDWWGINTLKTKTHIYPVILLN